MGLLSASTLELIIASLHFSQCRRRRLGKCQRDTDASLQFDVGMQGEVLTGAVRVEVGTLRDNRRRRAGRRTRHAGQRVVAI